MNTTLSVIVGLIWGGLFGLIGALITKKMAAGDQKAISSLSLIRTLIDAAALAAVYFTRNLLPLQFGATLISTAVSLTLIGTVAAFRTAAKMK
ncbi:MAG: hypothetical protein IJH48_01505 [Oscillospiraceae bacterium]|nr:hypothetical protein [Oscillospiraceae bacterium]